MMSNEVLNGVGGAENYVYEHLWELCAHVFIDLPKCGDKVYYFPQGHLENIEGYTREDFDLPVFDLPSKLLCRVLDIELKAEKGSDEVYSVITLIPDTTQVIVPIPNGNHQRPIVHSFTKVLTSTDVSTDSGFSLPQQDMSQQLPSQELVAKDLHGDEWRFNHIFRDGLQKHLFTAGWSTFATAKNLVVGDSFIFVRGENGEIRVGIRRAGHQQCNIPSTAISKQTMQHGVLTSAMHAFRNQCMFIVIYKPRSSQFFVSYEKFVNAINNKFSVGSRFNMRFKGDDCSEKRYSGTIIGSNDFSSQWKHSEWRNLQVQWDEHASFPRPDKVSKWEIEYITSSSSYVPQVHDIGSTSNLLTPTLINGQSNRESSMSSLMNVPQLSHAMMPKPNDNIDQMVLPKTERITTVQMEGVLIERTLNLANLDGYNKLIEELEKLFDLKGQLEPLSQWEIIFTDMKGDMMLVRDHSWPDFCNMVKKIFICSKEKVKK